MNDNTEINGYIDIPRVEAALETRDQLIRDLKSTLKRRDEQIMSQQREILARDALIQLLHDSISWRMMAPIRFLSRLLRGPWDELRSPGRVARECAVWFRSVLPLPRRWRRSVMRLPAPPDDTAARRSKPFPTRDMTKEEYRHQLRTSLKLFLDSGARLCIPETSAPLVSILLVSYNQAELTLACLQSIVDTVTVPAEVIIVDNGSRDETRLLFERLDGATIHRLKENLHFLRGVNYGAASANGQYLLLLNNDAVLRPGALEAALDSIATLERVGAVGGRIVLPHGRLQEAGSIIWADGSCLGYGRGDEPTEGPYMFRRDVDYCSGAFLLLRRELFESFGRFDEAFAPAYYEETDFCVRLREAGWRVIYDPRVAIVHFEFGSSNSNEAAVALQQRNHALFCARHETYLKGRPSLADQRSRIEARTAGHRPRRILVIDDRVPHPSLGGGLPRAHAMLHALHKEGFFITFYPLQFPFDDWEAVRGSLPLDVEVMLGYGIARLEEFLSERAGYYDALLVSRPHNMATVLRHLESPARWLNGCTVIYDAEAVFANRELLRLKMEGKHLATAEKDRIVEKEISLARCARHVLAVSEVEAVAFRQHGCSSVHVLGHTLAPSPTPKPFDRRSDLLFVGALNYDPSPNVDAVVWFVEEVLPLLRSRIGEMLRLFVAGQCSVARVLALHGPEVVVLGRICDLRPWYDAARVFIAPNRYAGGIPYKVHEAASMGVPVATTRLIAGQLCWKHGVELVAGDTAEEFAEGVVALYRQQRLWTDVREAALKALEADCSIAKFAEILRSVTM